MLYALVAIMGLGVVDSYFIGFLGANELAAIALIIPIMGIVTNIGLGVGMAISSLTSKLVGGGRLSEAARLITDGFYLTALVAFVTLALLYSQLETIFTLIGANDQTLPHIKRFMAIWLFAAPLTMYVMVTASTFRSIGDTVTSARISIVMTLSNMLLDPLFIFGWGPVPEMGIAGAALATLVSVIIAASWGIYSLAFHEKLLLWALPKWQALKNHVSDLVEIAIPAVLANVIVPLTAAVITKLVSEFGNNAVAGYGVGTRVEQVCLMVVYALSATLPMFIGQNLGANEKQRVAKAIKLAFKFVVVLQLGLWLVMLFAAQPISTLFSDSTEVQATIALYLWIVPASYGLSGVVILINVAMNVLGKPKLALYINLLRLFLFYLPLAYVGGQIYGTTGLFIGIAVGNGLAYLLARHLLKKTLRAMEIEA